MAQHIETRLFINNEFRAASSKETFAVRNPYNNSIVAENVHAAGEQDVDDAVNSALQAFKSWRKTPAPERARYMLKLADLIDENLEWLAEMETAAMGTPISVTKGMASSMSTWWRYYAGWADKITGESLVDLDGSYRIVKYEPLGVCAGLASFNATLFYLCWKIAPAVAAGNTFIFKSSEKSPLGALRFAELVKKAGFPDGVISIISGLGQTGGYLASHMKVRKISFTGSTATGRKIQIAAANSNMKRVTLELGGKSPGIVFEDANLDLALTHMSQSFLLNSGQVCAATSRLLVQDTIAERFVAELKARFQALTQALGDPADPKTYLGPIADSLQRDRVMSFLESAKRDNLNIVVGGDAQGDLSQFVQPTIIFDPPKESTVYKDEIFGPVLVVKTFKTEEDAVTIANDSFYGLGAAIFTGDVSRGLRLSSDLECGYLGINMPVIPSAWTPFGGVKESGHGREGGKQGLLAYMDVKTIAIAMPKI